MKRIMAIAVGLAMLTLSSCASEIPVPTLPVVTTHTQVDAVRVCREQYAQCNVPCNAIVIWNGLEMNRSTRCHNTCKQSLGECYTLAREN